MRSISVLIVLLMYSSSQALVSEPSPEALNSPKEYISLSGLSLSGAVEWGPHDQPPLAIFTDYRCPYSRAMVQDLIAYGIHVIEYPISVLGSRDLAEAVICSPNRYQAMRDAYGRKPLPVEQCDTTGLDENEAFAARNGFDEVPILVRSDGAVLRGYHDSLTLKAWLAQSAN